MAHHVCYEGTLACSGVNPCRHCLDVVNKAVLGHAMYRTREAVRQTRGDAGVVYVAELLDASQFWALFFGFYEEGWRQLHTNMMQDPEVTRRAFDTSRIPREVFEHAALPPPAYGPPGGMAAAPFPAPTPYAAAPFYAPPPPPAPHALYTPPESSPAFAPVATPSPFFGGGGFAFPLKPAPESVAAQAQPQLVSPVETSLPANAAMPPAVSTPSGRGESRGEITVDDIAGAATPLDPSDHAASALNGAGAPSS